MGFLSRFITSVIGYRKLLRELWAARKEVDSLFRFETLVHDITTRFIYLTKEGYDEAIQTLLRDIGSIARVDRAYLFTLDEDGVSVHNTHEWRAIGYIKPIDEELKHFPINTYKYWRRYYLLDKEYILLASPEELPAEAEAERRFMALGGVQSLLIVPLFGRGRFEGFIGFDSVRSPKKWDKKEIYLLESVAQDIVNLRLRWEAEKQLAKIREEDLDTSSRIQRAILISEPELNHPCVDIAAFSIPSQEVDGDFYNAMMMSEDAFDVLVGDVMGKGLPGAFIAAAVKNQFLQIKLDIAVRSGGHILPDPQDIVNEVASKINAELIELDSFVTLSYSRFYVRKSRFDFVDCGHMPVIHFNSETGRCWFLKGRSLPLGFSEDENFMQQSVPFGEGDILFFYSDGITEARNHKGNFFGEGRLVSVIERSRGEKTAVITNAVREEVLRFCGKTSPSDDLTCVAVKLTGLPGEIRRRHGVFPKDISSLPRIRAFIEEGLAEYTEKEISVDVRLKIVLAGNEASSNIIKHGITPHASEASGFYLELGKAPGWIFLRFIYSGEPFVYTGPQAKPDIEKMKEHGYGILIMEEFMDSVTYANDNRGGMMMTLVKRFDKENRINGDP